MYAPRLFLRIVATYPERVESPRSKQKAGPKSRPFLFDVLVRLLVERDPH
jgi:hypothetical protein